MIWCSGVYKLAIVRITRGRVREREVEGTVVGKCQFDLDESTKRPISSSLRVETRDDGHFRAPWKPTDDGPPGPSGYRGPSIVHSR